jgi:hypothetical protein
MVRSDVEIWASMGGFSENFGARVVPLLMTIISRTGIGLSGCFHSELNGRPYTTEAAEEI